MQLRRVQLAEKNKNQLGTGSKSGGLMISQCYMHEIQTLDFPMFALVAYINFPDKHGFFPEKTAFSIAFPPQEIHCPYIFHCTSQTDPVMCLESILPIFPSSY